MDSAQICIVHEVVSGNLDPDRPVRVTGRVTDLQGHSCHLILKEVFVPHCDSTILIDTTFISDTPVQQGSLYEFTGDLIGTSCPPALKVRTVRSKDGLDTVKYYQALLKQRDFLSNRNVKRANQSMPPKVCENNVSRTTA